MFAEISAVSLDYMYVFTDATSIDLINFCVSGEASSVEID